MADASKPTPDDERPETERPETEQPEGAAPGGVGLVKGEVTRGRRSLSPRALVAAAVAGAVLVGGGIAFAVTQTGDGDGGNELGDLATDDQADVGAVGAEIDRGWRELDSVRVRIESPVEASLATDVRLDREGDCVGTFGRDGGIAEVRSVDGTFYYRPGADYWEAQLASAQTSADPGQAATVQALRDVIGERWVDGGPVTDDSTYGAFCANGIDALIPADYDPAAFAADGWQVGGTADVDGTPVVTVEKAGTATLFVATEGEPWVLRAEVGDGEESATYTFTEQDEPLEVTAPPATEIVTTEELQAAVAAVEG